MNKTLAFLWFISSYCLGQDLIITSLGGTKTFGANDIFSGTSTTIKNAGIVDINTSVYVDFYFSTDDILDGADLPVGSGFSQGLIKAGESKLLPYYSGAKQITLPSGAYYLIAIVDSHKYVTETDEMNNTFVSSGYTVNPSNFDFSFSSFTTSNTLTAQDIFPVEFVIAGSGIYSSVNRLFTSFYLSQDQTLDAGDSFCGKFSNWLNEPLNSNEGYSYGDQLQIPNTTIGQYYLIAKIDAENRYVETNENNNTSVFGLINIVGSNIDIKPTQLSISSSGSNYIDLNLQLCNLGTTGAANVSIQYAYLTTNSSGSGSGYPINYLGPSDKIYVGGSQCDNSFFFTSIQSSNIPLGVYYLVVVIDYPNDTNPSNNTLVSSNTVQVGTPRDISVTNAFFTGKYDNTDRQFTGTTQYRNNSTDYFSDVISYQLTIRNASNEAVHTQLISNYIFAGGGQTTSSNWSVTLANPLPLGIYSANLSCADPSKCQSYSFDFTLSVDQPLRTLSGSLVGEDGVPLSQGKLFLYQKNDNGRIAFTQKIDPTTSSNFTFDLDNHLHTLYFIPDRTQYPDYVPTILGKTVTLSTNNFITISKDSTIVFEILKLKPLSSGSQTIEGNVSTGSNSSGRKSGRQANEGIVVLLLNSQGEVVAITETDANGNYVFANLPASTFGVLIPFQLDQPQLMNSPVTVDVRSSSKDVSFNFSNGPAIISSKSLQTIQFGSLSPVSYASGPISLSGSSSSGLPLSYESSDASIATIVNNQITIFGAGTTTITATQLGNSEFKAASSVSQLLQINKANQSITLLSELGDIYSNELPFTLEASSTSGLPVEFSISEGSSVATLNGSTLSLTGLAGDVTIVANQNGNNNYNKAEPIIKTFKVSLILSAVETIQLKAFPNPTNRMVKISSLIPFKTVGLFDLLGKVTLQDQKSVENELDLDLSGYGSGIYFLHLELENGFYKQIKIIKHH